MKNSIQRQLILPAALLIGAMAVLPAAARELSIVAQAGNESSFITAPGEAHSLVVSARRGDGTPVPGLTIRFNAPGEGAGGTFPESTEFEPTFIRVETNANGDATVSFVTGPIPGVFLVEAIVEGSSASLSYAFTNAADPPDFAMQPTAVRDAVLQWVADSGELVGLSALVHGPVLVPGGSVIASASPENPTSWVEPLVAERDSWLLWIDDFPFADHAHATRLILLDAAETGPNVLDNAGIISTRWWPIVRLPNDGRTHSLAPPAGPGDELEDVEVAALSLPSGLNAAPADACAILIHGPNMQPGSRDILNYRKYLLSNNLVSSSRIKMSLKSDGANSFRIEPVSRNDFDRIVKETAKLNCKKGYLLFAAHGIEPENGGGLIVKSDQQGGKNASLSFEEYVRILKQLGGVELCIVQPSCFAGALLTWVQGHGFTGSVIAASSEVEPAYHDAGGHFFVQAFLAAKKNSSADTDGDGKVSDQEALDWVKKNDKSPFTFPGGLQVDRIQTADPQGGTISATGTRRFSAGLIYIPQPGSSKMLLIKRPPFVADNTTLAVTIKISDAKTATTQTTQVTLGPFVPLIPIPIVGVDCGITSYEITAQDGNQKYKGSNVVQVGHFRPSVKKVTVAVGSEVQVDLTVFGALMAPADGRVDTSSKFDITPADKTIAVPDPSPLDLPSRAPKVSFKVKGLKVGKTTFDILLRKTGSVKTIEVNVVAADQRQSMNLCDPFDRETAFAVTDVRNVFDHPISLRSLFNGRVASNGMFHIDGAPGAFIKTTGMFDCNSGEFMLSGNSGSMTIAGFSDVPARAEGHLHAIGNGTSFPVGPREVRQNAGDAGAMIVIDYTLGEGVFPGGPIAWTIEGTLAGAAGGECSYALDPAMLTLSSGGGSGSLSVITQDGCGWTASSAQSWISLPAGPEGTGAGTVEFSVEANPGAGPRNGTITVTGSTLTVVQDGTSNPRPVISRAGVVNGASFVRGIAPATWISILGTNLAPTARTWGDADFNGANLPTSLDGVSVTINGRPAYVFFISPNQLNVLAPDDPRRGGVKIRVTTPAGSSDPYSKFLLETDPALFQFSPEGRRYAAAVHADGTFAGKPGLFAGLTTPVVVRIGGRDAVVLFAGIVGSGLYQFNVVTPDLEPGDHEIGIFVGGVPIEEGVHLTIEP